MRSITGQGLCWPSTPRAFRAAVRLLRCRSASSRLWECAFVFEAREFSLQEKHPVDQDGEHFLVGRAVVDGNQRRRRRSVGPKIIRSSGSLFDELKSLYRTAGQPVAFEVVKFVFMTGSYNFHGTYFLNFFG